MPLSAAALASIFSSFVAPADSAPPNTSQPASAPTTALEEVTVTAARLNAERAEIETQTGASTYTIDSAAIAATPGGENVQLNQVLLQAPDVVQDSFGQIHVRGDHNDLQYRLNGIILPEGISVFGQSLDPRLISSLSLITGALPAEYGLRTAGVIDMTTGNGLQKPGGSVSVYGGSHGEFEPSVEYGGSSGNLTYFVTVDMLRNDLGIESPDGSSNPIHDHATQTHAFGYFEDILDTKDRLALVLGAFNGQYQIPNQNGLQPDTVLGTNSLPLQVQTPNGIQNTYLSNGLNENQHELTQYAIVSLQHSEEAFHFQSSLSVRYTSLDFEPDWIGDLLFNGIAQNAFKADTALGWQTDSVFHLSEAHTLRAGFYIQHDSSTSTVASQVLPIDENGNQTSNVPLTIQGNGSQTQWIDSVYLQDEWKPVTELTVNYGLRGDRYTAYSSGSQLSPRVNVVWLPLADTTVHGGYSRYFTPPPFELIGGGTFSQFANTTALPPGSNTLDTAPLAAREDYYDVGVQQKLLAKTLTLGVDSYLETAQNLIDEGQFGAPIILTPFNYRFGRIEGIEFTANYTVKALSTYANLSFQSAKGKGVESSQFNFSQYDLNYIADNYIHLDHEERVSASAGFSYLWLGTRYSADMIFGTGLRQALVFPGGDIPNGDHTPSYVVINTGLSHVFSIPGAGTLTARLDAINVTDQIYFIRSGTGIGVFAPQYGARRGLFVGLSKSL
jgi:outer membrane cobalamin receptor